MKHFARFILFTLIASISFAQDVTPKGQQQNNFPIAKKKGGVVLGSDHVDGIHYQLYKVTYGPDGAVTRVDTTSPLPVLQTELFGVEVASRKLRGLSHYNLVGEVDGVGTAEVTAWQGLSRYSYIDEVGGSSRILSVASDDADDTALGTGARQVIILGMDTNYVMILDTVALSGLDSVDTSIEFLRVFRAWVYTAGSQSENDGVVDIGVGAFTSGSADTIYAIIEATRGQTSMGVFTVPANMTGYVMDVGLTTNEGKSIEAFPYIRPLNGAWRSLTKWNIFEGSFYRPLPIPFMIGEKTDLDLRVSSSAAGTDFSGTFTILLVTN